MTKFARLFGAGTVLAGSLVTMGANVPVTLAASQTITIKVPSVKSMGMPSLGVQYSLFQKAHPNVKLVQVPQPTNLNAALTAGDAPDLIAPAGPAQAKLMYQAGQLLSLNQYYKKYHWDKRILAPERDVTLYHGKYVSVPLDIEGIFMKYNATMFKKNGWAVPKNYNQLMTLSSKIQQTGVMPWAYGNSDYPAMDEFWISAVVNSVLGKNVKQLWSGNIAWTDPRVETGLQRFVDYYQKGYITQKKSFAVSSTGADTLFANQRAAMEIVGTWNLATVSANSQAKTKFQIKYAELPGWLPNGKPTFPQGTGGAFAINAKSQHPELVADLLNYMFHPKVELVMAQQGGPAADALVNYNKMAIPQQMKVGLNMMQSAAKNGTAGYVDYAWASPGVINQLETNGSSLYLKKQSVAQWCQQTEQIKQKDKKDGTLVGLEDYK